MISTNPDSVYSEPVITVNGSGNITLIVSVTIVELSGVSGSIPLDSALQEANSGFASHKNQVSGEFPRLLPGQNAISRMGNAASLTIAPNWRSV